MDLRQGAELGLRSSIHVERTEPHLVSIFYIPSVPLGILMISQSYEGGVTVSVVQTRKLRIGSSLLTRQVGATSLTPIRCPPVVTSALHSEWEGLGQPGTHLCSF